MTQYPALMPDALGVQLLLASSQVTLVVQVRPQLYVERSQVPKSLHSLREQNGPLSGPASADAPQSVPAGAYALHDPVESQNGPQIGSLPNDAAHFPPGSVPGVAAVQVPTFPVTVHD